LCVAKDRFKQLSTKLFAQTSFKHISSHTKSLVDPNLEQSPINRSKTDKMCYKETLYYGKCGCYSKPQFVGEPCIRVQVNPTLRSTGCWDVGDMGVKSLNKMCRKCEVAESLSNGSDRPISSLSGSEKSNNTPGSSSASTMSIGSSSVSSRSGSSENEGKKSSRAQACVSLSGMASYKRRHADGGLDRSTTAYQAFHETEGRYWTSESHKTPYVDRMYALGLPGKVHKLDSSME
jgi:hypothetical protein